MKKFASLLLILVALSSCTEDLSKNNPAFEGLRDDSLWRSRESWAELAENGSVTITGMTAYETVILKMPSTAEIAYPLGTSVSRRGYYISNFDGVEETYSTGSSFGDGMIVIEEYDSIKQTITGRFRFNAEHLENYPDGPVVNFRDGHFYKVPVIPAITAD